MDVVTCLQVTSTVDPHVLPFDKSHMVLWCPAVCQLLISSVSGVSHISAVPYLSGLTKLSFRSAHQSKGVYLSHNSENSRPILRPYRPYTRMTHNNYSSDRRPNCFTIVLLRNPLDGATLPVMLPDLSSHQLTAVA